MPLTPGLLGKVDAALVALLIGFGPASSSGLAADLIWLLAWFVPQLLVGLGALGLYWWDRRRQKKITYLLTKALSRALLTTACGTALGRFAMPASLATRTPA